jgi:hypothetical protein
MHETNPYRPPAAAVVTLTGGIDDEDVASGQRLVIYAFLGYLVSMALMMVMFGVAPFLRFAPAAFTATWIFANLLSLAALVTSWFGVWRLATGMDWPFLVKVVLLALTFVPLVNMIMLAICSGRATWALRNAGYTPGWLGASKKTGAPPMPS